MVRRSSEDLKRTVEGKTAEKVEYDIFRQFEVMDIQGKKFG